jgi:hypothetical protein
MALMREHTSSRAQDGLKAILADAVAALACLDAVRLEELAASCQVLQCGPSVLEFSDGKRDRESLAGQAQNAAKEFAAFKGVLQATRANLDVVRRLSCRERVFLEYSATAAGRGAIPEGTGHGDD